MTAVEMHAFEDAMMDDPFLADAVDGYRSAAAIHIQSDLDQLKQRLNPAEKKATVVTGFFKPWMRIAAGLAILVSVSVVMYRSFNQPEQKATAPIIAELKQADTVSTVKTETTVDSTTVAVNEPSAPVFKNPAVPLPVPSVKPEVTEKVENTIAASEQPAPVVSAPTVNNDMAGATSAVKKEDIRFKESEAVEDKKQSNFIALKKFTGVVVDENNQPVPFANITETRSGVGTYADVNGNFTMVAADSVLNIETRSVGYFNNALQIRNNQTQRIVLKDQSVIANAPTRERLYEKNKDRPPVMKTEVTEIYSEPADGWNNYSKYIANNLREGNLKEKRNTNALKEVEVSFDVNPDGTVANLKVERSNCSNCNTEAIRIIKDGPRWKSKTGKTERTRFTVLFNE